MMNFKTWATVVIAFILCSLMLTEPAFALTCDMNQYTVTPITGSTIDYGDTQWPIGSIKISDPFGSRELTKNANNNNYDLHRGLDLQEEKGIPVYAIADGKVTKIQHDCCKDRGDCPNPISNCSFPDGGNVVVIEHSLSSTTKFNLNDQSFSKYYSIYSHLDDFKKDDMGGMLTTGTITKGSRIGSVGSIDANYAHLHLETRVGTTCSGESQLKPQSSCFQTPAIDPSVHPFYFLDYVNGIYNENNNYDICVTKSSNLQVTFESSRDELDFNEIEVVYPEGTKKINFSTKAGIKLANVDENPYDSVEIIPSDFKSNTEKYTIKFNFTNLTDFNEINVRDIWGNGKKIVPNP